LERGVLEIPALHWLLEVKAKSQAFLWARLQLMVVKQQLHPQRQQERQEEPLQVETLILRVEHHELKAIPQSLFCTLVVAVRVG